MFLTFIFWVKYWKNLPKSAHRRKGYLRLFCCLRRYEVYWRALCMLRASCLSLCAIIIIHCFFAASICLLVFLNARSLSINACSEQNLQDARIYLMSWSLRCIRTYNNKIRNSRTQRARGFLMFCCRSSLCEQWPWLYKIKVCVLLQTLFSACWKVTFCHKKNRRSHKKNLQRNSALIIGAEASLCDSSIRL